jgi:AraC family transcriptional regulator
MGYYNDIRNTVDYIEENLCEELSLKLIAGRLSFSSYHFHRVFHYVTGITLMEYVRKRRLSLSAELLLHTDTTIIEIAIKLFYKSPEAYTRAFKRYFGINPGEFRVKRTNLTTFERLGEHQLTAMEYKSEIDLLPSRIETKNEFKVIGYELDTAIGDVTIPEFWNTYLNNDWPDTIPNWLDPDRWVDLGICYNGKEDGSFKYLLGMEVTSFDNAPENSICRTFPTLTYAIFTTPKVPRDVFISSIGKSWNYIFKVWLDESGYEIAQGPQFELYDERCQAHIDSQIDIYIPVINKMTCRHGREVYIESI